MISDDVLRLLTLADSNTRVVVLGTTLLGAASGLVGSFLLLRKRALLSDTLSHATLPGVVLAYMVSLHFGGDGRSLPVLLAGGAASAVLGTLLVLAIRGTSRLKDDAAQGIVLSVFFAIGLSLLAMAARLPQGNPAGLMGFIYGKAASMLWFDAVLIGGVALFASLMCVVLFKELRLLCFDSGFASVQGWPTVFLDCLLMGLIVAVTVVGLQSVGLILVVAMLVIPAAAARFWTHSLSKLLAVAAALGGASGFVGTLISALLPNMPAGALIVMVAIGFFVLSLLLGSRRGIVQRVRHTRALARSVRRQHLLRAIYELAEARGGGVTVSVTTAQLAAVRAWSPGELPRALREAMAENLVCETSSAAWQLTPHGEGNARRVVRNHRLWELFLITHADVATARVDQGADEIEHVLGEELTAELEALMSATAPPIAVPPNPHDPLSKGAAIA